jgi:soluble lytic murein transglycosylase
MRWRHATVASVALLVTLCPATATPQTDGPALWLAPAASAAAARPASAFATAVRQLADGKAALALPTFSKSVSDALIGGYALLMQGRAQLALKETRDARFSASQLAKVERRDYLREAALVLLADVAETEGDSAAEMQALQQAVALQPVTGAPLFLRLGRAARDAGEVSVARGALNTVVYNYPLSPEATDALKDLAALDPGAVPTRDTATATLGRGEQLFGAKRFADAKAAFDSVRDLAVGDEKDLVALRIAQCDLGLKKYTAARAGLEPLVTQDGPRQAEARYAMLGVVRGLGKKEAFVTSTREFVDSGVPDQWAEAALNDLATFYILEDEDANAFDVFGEMLRRFPSGANAERAAWRWGWWSYTKGNYADTIRVFDDAFSTFGRSDYRSAWSYWSARARQNAGQRDDAMSTYRRTLALYQHSYYGREADRSLRAMLGTPSRGVLLTSRDTTATFAPGEPPLNARLITRLLDVGMYDDALGELKRAELDNGATPVNTATQAYAWNRKGELRIGITLMKRAYPQFLSAGGEALPSEMRRVIFPMAYWDLIQKYAKANGLDPYLMAALITQESTFDKDIKSAANAWGLMQVLPSTGKSYAKKLGIKSWRTTKLTDAEINIRIGMAYFADMSKRYDGIVGALVAYNAGGSRYRRWVTEYPGADQDEFIDNIPFFETQNYLKRILGTADEFRTLYPPSGPGRKR